jgi:methylmalonyl-CoA mutase cobalamin-binding domain/chain
MDPLVAVRDAVLAGDAVAAEAAARHALAAGGSPQAIVAGGLAPALDEAGRLFEAGEYFLPDLLVAARATKAVFDVLRPLLAGGGAPAAGRVALGTVRGDMHDIGKNLVGAMLEGAGFEVVDLGIDVPPERFAAQAAPGSRIDVIGLSALLTTSLPSMQQTVAAIRASGSATVRVIVGGAPVTPGFAASVGADGYAPNASAAVELVRSLVGARGAAPDA